MIHHSIVVPSQGVYEGRNEENTTYPSNINVVLGGLGCEKKIRTKVAIIQMQLAYKSVVVN